MRRRLAMGVSAMLAVSGLACGSTDDGSTGQSGEAVSGALRPVLMGVNSSGLSEFESATGLKAQVVRAYLNQGRPIPSSVASANLEAYYQAGQAVVYSIKADTSPDGEATNKAHLSALAKDIVAKGYASRTWIVLHHEPFPELSGAAFQAMYAKYAPSIRQEHVRCGVIYQVYPAYHQLPTYVEDYTSGILPLVDFIGIDEYPDAAPGGYASNILADISPFTAYAKKNGKPFQIDEVAVSSAVSGSKQAQASWLSGLMSLGGDVEIVAYFEGSPTSLKELHIENNPAAVTAWKTLEQSLTSR